MTEKSTIVAKYKGVETYSEKELINIYLELNEIDPNKVSVKISVDSIDFDIRKKDYYGREYQDFLQEAKKYFKWKYLCNNLISKEDSKGVVEKENLDSLISYIVDPDHAEIYVYEDWKIEITDRVNKEDWELIPQK